MTITGLTTDVVAMRLARLKEVLGTNFNDASNHSLVSTYDQIDSIIMTLYLRSTITAEDVQSIIRGEDRSI